MKKQSKKIIKEESLTEMLKLRNILVQNKPLNKITIKRKLLLRKLLKRQPNLFLNNKKEQQLLKGLTLNDFGYDFNN